MNLNLIFPLLKKKKKERKGGKKLLAHPVETPQKNIYNFFHELETGPFSERKEPINFDASGREKIVEIVGRSRLNFNLKRDRMCRVKVLVLDISREHSCVSWPNYRVHGRQQETRQCTVNCESNDVRASHVQCTEYISSDFDIGSANLLFSLIRAIFDSNGEKQTDFRSNLATYDVTINSLTVFEK